jgi:dTDP-4-amino-4,6-dideoxygalactose transaminase
MSKLIFKENRIFLSPPQAGQLERDYVTEAFDNNWLAPVGDNINIFEAAIAKAVGGNHAVVLSSGTAAIHLSLVMLDVQPGDVIICQDLTFAASCFPIRYMRAEPYLVDSEPNSWNMDPAQLREAIQHALSRKKKVKAIIPVHLYGMPARMDEIFQISQEFDIPIIEDAAEALGSSFHQRPLGSWSDYGVLSFNGNKIITTSGGGALVTNNSEIAYLAKKLSTQAREPFLHFEHNLVGYNYRMSNVLAGIGRGQIATLGDRVEARRKNFERYKSYFEEWNQKGFHFEFQSEAADAYSNRWLSCVLIDPMKNNNLYRDLLLVSLENDNIESRPTWKPLHLQPVFKHHKYFGADVGVNIFNNGICLPSGSSLEDDDFSRIFECLDRLIMRYHK